jgi:hypothetical protein
LPSTNPAISGAFIRLPRIGVQNLPPSPRQQRELPPRATNGLIGSFLIAENFIPAEGKASPNRFGSAGRTLLSAAFEVGSLIPRSLILAIAPQRLATRESKSKAAGEGARATPLSLLIQQFGEVPVVVEHGAVVHELQDLVHFFPVLAVHVVEADGDA